MTLTQVGTWVGYALRWGLLVYAMTLSPWPVALVLSMFGVGIDLLWYSLKQTQEDLQETRDLIADYVEADCAFTSAVTKVLEHQFRTLDKQEMLSSLHASARSVTRH